MARTDYLDPERMKKIRGIYDYYDRIALARGQKRPEQLAQRYMARAPRMGGGEVSFENAYSRYANPEEWAKNIVGPQNEVAAAALKLEIERQKAEVEPARLKALIDLENAKTQAIIAQTDRLRRTPLEPVALGRGETLYAPTETGGYNQVGQGYPPATPAQKPLTRQRFDHLGARQSDEIVFPDTGQVIGSPADPNAPPRSFWLGQGQIPPATGQAVPPSSIRMRAPNGMLYDIDPSEVQQAIQNGWMVIG